MAERFADVTADDIRGYSDIRFGADEFNDRLSTGTELRYGAKGGVKVNLTGRWRGRYVDFEHDKKGWVLPGELQPKRGGRLRDTAEAAEATSPASAAASGAFEEPPPGNADAPAPPKGRSTAKKLDAEEQARQARAAAEATAKAECQRQAAKAAKLTHIREQWALAESLAQTPGERYLLEHRNLAVPLQHDQLRWAPAHQLTPDGAYKHAALLVPFRHAADPAAVVGLGAIRIDPATGAKAKLDVPKPAYHIGAELDEPVFVQLGDPDATTLVVAEGLETGLARLSVAPCDLRVCWGPLRFIPPPEHVRRVEIVADRDKISGARKLAREYARGNRQAYVVTPPRETGAKGDLNDVLLQHPGQAGLEVLRRLLGEAERIEPASGAKATRALGLQHGSDVEIAQKILETLEDLYGPIIVDDGVPWYFDGQQYRALQGHVLNRHIHSADGQVYIGPNGPVTVKLSKFRINSIADSMLTYRQQPGFFTARMAMPIIPCANGALVFDAESGEYRLEEHARRHRNRFVLAGRFDEGKRTLLRRMAAGDADSQRAFAGTLLGALISGCFRDDDPTDAEAKAKLLQEILGVAAGAWSTRLRSPVAHIAYGMTAANGKSQWSDLLRNLAPPEAVASVSPSQFGNEYYTHRLTGVMINAADELPEQAIKSDRFKQIITGEPVPARQIYQAAGEVRCTALHFYTCNELPLFSGGIDAGVLRRLSLIQFNRTIPPEERIEDLGKRIAAEEADLLLVFAAEGLRRVLQQRDYTQPPSSAQVLAEYLEEADPVRGWCAQRLHIDPNDNWKLSSAEAYADFTAWCHAQGIKDSFIVGNRAFGKRLLRTDPRIRRYRSDGSYYVGVKLKPL
jgi:hypothetical protein